MEFFCYVAFLGSFFISKTPHFDWSKCVRLWWCAERGHHRASGRNLDTKTIFVSLVFCFLLSNLKESEKICAEQHAGKLIPCWVKKPKIQGSRPIWSLTHAFTSCWPPMLQSSLRRRLIMSSFQWQRLLCLSSNRHPWWSSAILATASTWPAAWCIAEPVLILIFEVFWHFWLFYPAASNSIHPSGISNFPEFPGKSFLGSTPSTIQSANSWEWHRDGYTLDFCNLQLSFWPNFLFA